MPDVTVERTYDDSAAAGCADLLRQTETDAFSKAYGNDIFLACKEGDVSCVRHLIQVKPSCLYETDKNGRIPLHEACRYGHIQIVRLLVSQPNASLSKSDFDNNLPLHEACKSGNSSLVEFLLACPPSRAGHVWNARNVLGRLLIHEAARSGAEDIVDLLLQYDSTNYNGLRKMDNDGRFPLHDACASGSLATVRRILRGVKKGAFQIRDKQGRFPLHHAFLSGGSPELIEFILEQHPLAEFVRDNQGRLPSECTDPACSLDVPQDQPSVLSSTPPPYHQRLQRVFQLRSNMFNFCRLWAVQRQILPLYSHKKDDAIAKKTIGANGIQRGALLALFFLLVLWWLCWHKYRSVAVAMHLVSPAVD